MKLKLLLRITLSIVLAIIGAFVTEGQTAMQIIAIFASATLGFILPEVVEIAGKAGIAALAKAIVGYLTNPPYVDKILSGASATERLVAGGVRQVGALAQAPLGFRRRPRGSQGKYVNPMVVDTSVLIDGRIIEVAATGFIFGTFLVIPAVIAELHKLADSSDDLKRARGRRGLEILVQLKKEKRVKVEILKSEPKAATVDDKIVKLASLTHGRLLTVDYNLNKVAAIGGVPTLNLNELANAVKTAVLPQESLTIKINSQGREKDQGIGYLADGTMVVVEGGAGLLGKTAEIVVQRVLQTAAGKMIFGKTK